MAANIIASVWVIPQNILANQLYTHIHAFSNTTEYSLFPNDVIAIDWETCSDVRFIVWNPVQITSINTWDCCSGTACCIWSVISSISNLNRWSSSLGHFCHGPLKRDQWNWDWRLRSEIEIRWHSKWNWLYKTPQESDGKHSQIIVYQIQPIAFGATFNLNLHSQSPWSLFNGTW